MSATETFELDQIDGERPPNEELARSYFKREPMHVGPAKVIEEAVARPDELHAQLRVRVEGVGSAHHVVDLYPFLVHIGQARAGIIVIPPLSRELTHIRPG